jgi:uncharacterized damage-inducible protein DinB
MSVGSSLAAFATLDESELARPWATAGGQLGVREALYRVLEEAQRGVTRAAALAHPEPRRILSLAQRGFGDLRGLLVGLPAEMLDRPPRPGDWSLRDILRHVLVVEHRYVIQTQYGVERSDSDPVRIADGRLPTPEQMNVSGDVAAILERIGQARAQTNRQLGEIAPAAMARPTVWAGLDVDVRFRLHRFAAHVVEHTIQAEKTLVELGWRESEGRRIARRIWAHVGELEGLGAPAEIQTVGATAERQLAEIRSS